MVQKARDADVFGILIGTLGVGQTHTPANTLRLIINLLCVPELKSLTCMHACVPTYLAQYLPMIKRLREMLKRAHKKTYTVSVGKLNPSKLANFMEIECFVLVACPENSVIDSKVCTLFKTRDRQG